MFLEFAFIFVLTLFFVATIRHFASTIGLVDIPNDRSAHKHITPRGAGIAFHLAVTLVITLFDFQFVQDYTSTLLAIFFVFFVGAMDDFIGTSPGTKLIVLFFAVIYLYFDHLVVTDLGKYFGVYISLGWLSLPFTLFAVLAFTNSLNLIDGLDGLAASLSMVIFSGFFAIGYLNDDMFMMLLSGAYFSALAAFLFFNWNPASIFMGDSGSLILGFVITIVAIKSLDHIPAISIIFLAALPIIDTMVVVIRRKRTGRGIFSADKCHLHHILYSFFGDDTKKTVLFMTGLQLVYGLMGLQFDSRDDGGAALIFFIFNILIVYYISSVMIRMQGRVCGKPKSREKG